MFLKTSIGRRLTKSFILLLCVSLCSVSIVSAQAPPTYIIRVGMTDTATNPSSLAALEFKKAVESESKGRIQVQIYLNGELGTIPSMMSQVKSGSLQMTALLMDYITPYYADIGIFGVLFLFPTRAEAYRTLDGRVGDDIKAQILSHTGIRVLGFGDFGYKDLFNRKGPVRTLADLKGLKLRVVPSPIAISSFRALGVVTSNIDFSEEYTAIQQGVIDGGEVPDATILSKKFYEVAPYLSQTHHVLGVFAFFMNDKFFTSLPPDLQNIVKDAGLKAQAYDRKASADSERTSLEELVSKGAKVNEVPPAELAKMRAVLQPTYEDAKKLGPQAAIWLKQLLPQ